MIQTREEGMIQTREEYMIQTKIEEPSTELFGAGISSHLACVR